MLATAIALQEVTKNAVHDEEVMDLAAAIYHHRNDMSGEEFAQALYMYSAHLSALTTTLATHALLTETQLDEMLTSIKEFEVLGKEITNGDN
jgi:hypothetical protein